MVLQYYNILKELELVRLASLTGGQIEQAEMLWIEINDCAVVLFVSGAWLDLKQHVNSSGLIHCIPRVLYPRTHSTKLWYKSKA